MFIGILYFGIFSANSKLWNETDQRPNFMSIDIYTCKDFNVKDVINFTKNIFSNEITEITWRE